MRLNVHFFNVNHGDSIVIEIQSDVNKYIVLDSNLVKKDSGFINPSYEFLKSKQVKTINAVIISHFDMDHIAGMEDFIENFDIQDFFIPPIFSKNINIFKKEFGNIAEKMYEIINRTSEESITRKMTSLAWILNFIRKNRERVQELCGQENRLKISGINEDEITGSVYLPIPKMKSLLHQIIEKGNFELDFNSKMNDISIAFKIEFCGYSLLFTGDSTKTQWTEHERILKKGNVTCLNATHVKVPHHGSREDNDSKVFRYFISDSSICREVFISANGVSHPHKEFFGLVEDFKLMPHCTNISEWCFPPNVLPFKNLSDIPKDMHSFLLNYGVESKPIPCQGDIVLSIDDSGYKIVGSTGLPCVYWS